MRTVLHSLRHGIWVAAAPILALACSGMSSAQADDPRSGVIWYLAPTVITARPGGDMTLNGLGIDSGLGYAYSTAWSLWGDLDFEHAGNTDDSIDTRRLGPVLQYGWNPWAFRLSAEYQQVSSGAQSVGIPGGDGVYARVDAMYTHCCLDIDLGLGHGDFFGPHNRYYEIGPVYHLGNVRLMLSLLHDNRTNELYMLRLGYFRSP